ncbi:MAG: hypothetical protein U0528_01645 [Anaerolineae bacterium]
MATIPIWVYTLLPLVLLWLASGSASRKKSLTTSYMEHIGGIAFLFSWGSFSLEIIGWSLALILPFHHLTAIKGDSGRAARLNLIGSDNQPDMAEAVQFLRCCLR